LSGSELRKICKTCEKEKSLDEFHANKEKRDGRSNHCKECYNARQRQLRIEKEGMQSMNDIKPTENLNENEDKEKQEEFSELNGHKGERQCYRCKEWKLKTVEFFYSKENGRFSGFCRECEKKRKRIKGIIHAPVDNPEHTKICGICKEEKEQDEFSLDRSKLDGRYLYCKECEKKRKEDIKISIPKNTKSGSIIVQVPFFQDDYYLFEQLTELSKKERRNTSQQLLIILEQFLEEIVELNLKDKVDYIGE